MPFLIALFHFETNLIKKRFFLFCGPFWTDGKFFLGRSEAEQLAGSDKKFFWLTDLFPKVPSFYIWTKFRLKVMQRQCIYYYVKQSYSFIYAFEGEIYGKLMNIHLGKPPLISKKSFLVCSHLSTSFTLVYIRLVYIWSDSYGDLSTLVYFCLDLSSDLPTFDQTRRDSLRLVITRLVTGLCLQNRS